MPQLSDDTMRELDEILNDNNADSDRLTAFLKLKTTKRRPQDSPEFLLGGAADIPFDVDVELIKLPENDKQKQQNEKKAAHQEKPTDPKDTQRGCTTKQPLRETDNTAGRNIKGQGHNLIVAESQPQTENISTSLVPIPVMRSHSLSPGHTIASSSPARAPETSDHLRRGAINKQIISGRRRLQNDFDNAVNETQPRSSGSFDFLPKVSSTPAVENTAQQQRHQKQLNHRHHQEEEEQQKSGQQRQQQQDKQQNMEPIARGSLAAIDIVPQHEQFEDIFQQRLMNLQRSGDLPFTLPKGTPSKKRISKQGTFTVAKKSTEPHRRLQSPLSTGHTNTIRWSTSSPSPSIPLGRLRRTLQSDPLPAAAQDVLATDTPKRTVPQSEPQPELIVPETQLQELCSPEDSPEVEAAADATPTAAAVSCGIQTSCIQNDEVYDDDGDSTLPLNLAPAGGNTTRQNRLRMEHEKEKTMLLLDLHRTRNVNLLKDSSTQRPTLAALNKPPMAAINGEKFAEELARMSNHEILDLRKRNSNGILITPKGQPMPKMDQMFMEHRIQMEMLRRNLAGDLLPSEVTASSQESEHSPLPPEIAISQPATPPHDFRNSLAKEQSLKCQQAPSNQVQRRGIPSKQRGPPMTTELRNYLTLSQTIERRLRSRSKSEDSKRSLYTKGNSDTEDNLSQLPEKQLHLRDTSILIAPSPPPATDCNESIDDIAIVPPPPASLRYSQCMRRSRRSVRFSTVDVATEGGEQFKNGKEGVQQEQEQPETAADEEELPETAADELEQPEKAADEEELPETAADAKEQPDRAAYEEELPETAPDEVMEEVEVPPPPVTEQKTSHRKELRMQPPSDLEPKRRSSLIHAILDDQPSTSKASLEALQHSISKQHTKNKAKKPVKDDELLFKKPLAPAPRKRKYMATELDKLRITLYNKTLPPDDNDTNDHETTGVRRSKRGQVPLRNTWVHTISEPFKFTFLDRSLSMYNTFEKDKRSKKKPVRDRKSNSVIKGPPLCSSTPRNGAVVATGSCGSSLKRKRNDHEKQPQEQLTGITPLSDITEEEGEQPLPQQASTQHTEIKKADKKSARKKKTKSADDPDKLHQQQHKRARNRASFRINSDSESEPEIELEPMPLSEETEPQPEAMALPEEAEHEAEAQPMALPEEAEHEAETEPMALPEEAEIVDLQPAELEPAPIVSAAQAQLLKVTSWLRGASDEAPEYEHNIYENENENDAMIYTSAGDLEFSTLDGVEYAFYATQDKCAMGYMRFQPLQQRGMRRNRSNTLRFLALYGEFDVELDLGLNETQKCVLKACDMVEIKMGNRFNITNRLDEVSILIVNRK